MTELINAILKSPSIYLDWVLGGARRSQPCKQFLPVSKPSGDHLRTALFATILVLNSTTNVNAKDVSIHPPLTIRLYNGAEMAGLPFLRGARQLSICVDFPDSDFERLKQLSNVQDLELIIEPTSKSKSVQISRTKRSIDLNFLDSLPNLRKLTLKSNCWNGINSIEQINVINLPKLTRLAELNIFAGNARVNFSSDLSNLKKLVISDAEGDLNQLRLTKLKSLLLERAEFKTDGLLPICAKKIRELKITAGPQIQLEKMPRLQKLALLNTDVSLPNAIGQCPSLQELYISFRDHQSDSSKFLQSSVLQPWRKIRSITIQNTKITPEAAMKFASLKSLKSLSFFECDDTNFNDIFPFLITLKKLETEPFSFSPAECLKHLPEISRIPKLKSLNLSGSNATDQDVEYLTRCKNLNELDLARCPISAKSLTMISKLHKLRKLDLSNTNFDPEALTKLRSLKLLKELCLDGDRLSFQHKITLPAGIQKLSLEDALVSSGTIKSLSTIKKLEFLNLRKSNIEDHHFDVAHFPRLNLLNIEETSITDSGLQKIFMMPGKKRCYVLASGTSIQAALLQKQTERYSVLQLNNVVEVNDLLFKFMNNASIHIVEGSLNYNQREFQQAVNQFHTAIEELLSVQKICGGNSKVFDTTDFMFSSYHGLGLALLALGRYEESLAALNSAFRFNAHSPLLYKDRATVYFKCGFLQKGLSDAKKAISIDPSLSSAYQCRDAIYEALGKHKHVVHRKNSPFQFQR